MNTCLATFAVNPCVELPCKNGGSCSVTSSGFSCKCKSGYEGTTCALCKGINEFSISSQLNIKMHLHLLRMSYRLLRLSYRLLKMSYRLLRMSYRLLIMSYRLLKMSYRLLRMSYRLLRMSYRLLRMSYRINRYTPAD